MMNSFSLFKRGATSGQATITTLIENCQLASDGDFSTRIDTDGLDEQLAEIANAVNAVLENAENKINVYERGVGQITEVLIELQSGNLEARLINIKDGSAVTPLMHAVNNFADITDAFVREAGASLDAVSRNIFYRNVMTTGLRGEFRRTAESVNDATASMGRKMDDFAALTERLVDNIRDIAKTTSNMKGSVSQVSNDADEAKTLSTSVAAAVEETTASLQSIASASEEMLVSVSEINRQVTQSTEITEDAAERMEESNDVVQALSNAASNINEVLELINTIAGQTNLLALNATIEAARAGDAGKGFAVVASEVKSLASQTAKATEDIAAQVSAMQDATNNTVATMDKLGSTVTKINEIGGAIASAITQQEATTREISSNIQNAAAGSQEVADNMQQVSVGAERNSETAVSLTTTMDGLEKQSIDLVTEATEFLQSSKRTGTN
jgi:methyl-accepting chemotaxis protein